MTQRAGVDLLNRVKRMRVHSLWGRCSTHKPLSLLWAIGRHVNREEPLVAFGEIEGDLNRLIRRFGPPHSRENAYDPFWRLQNDGLWHIDRPELVTETMGGSAHISDLREHGIRGGLTQDFIDSLNGEPDLAWRVVQHLLDDFFPPSLHEDVLRDVGLTYDTAPRRLTGTRSEQDGRDPGFREVILEAYQHRCALCELDVQVDGRPVGLEAAHIKWHSAGGPAVVENGICLCVLHHKFFDSGLFSITSDLTVVVGELAEGNSLPASLSKYHGSMLPVIPKSLAERPAARYLEWHAKAVFKR